MNTFEEFKKLMQDESIKQELKDLITEQKPENEDAYAQALVDFAASKGLDLIKESKTSDDTGIEELSLDELDNVSGGTGGAIMDILRESYNMTLGALLGAIEGSDKDGITEVTPNQDGFWKA